MQIAISSEENSELAGVPSNYLSKLLRANPVRRVGPRSMGAVMGVLAIRCLVVEDAAALARYGGRVRRRNPNMVHAGASIVFTARFMAKIQRQGGHARANALSPARRSEIARRAAMARWGDPHRKRKIERI